MSEPSNICVVFVCQERFSLSNKIKGREEGQANEMKEITEAFLEGLVCFEKLQLVLFFLPCKQLL